MRNHLVMLCFPLLMVSACSVGPDYVPPELELKHPPPQTESVQIEPEQPLSIPGWNELFTAESITELLALAERGNKNLDSVRASVREARYLSRVSRIELLPIVTADAEYSQSRMNAFASGFGEGQMDAEIYSAGFDATWEIDILGGKRREIQANEAVESQFSALYDDALVTLKGEILSALVDSIISKERTRVLRATAKRQRKLLSLIESRVESGESTALDLNRSEALLREARALLPPERILRSSALFRINVLLGREPNEPAQAMPTSLKPGKFKLTGSLQELLANRPDVRAAESELAASVYRIGAETADLYPRFFFDGSVGLDFPVGNTDNEAETWRFGPSIRWAFLDSFRQAQEVYAQEERAAAAFARFEESVLLALEDISSAIVGYQEWKKAFRERRRASAASRQVVELSTARFESGFSDFFEVLEAEQDLLSNQLDELAAQRAYLLAIISLRKSLGGAADAAHEKKGK